MMFYRNKSKLLEEGSLAGDSDFSTKVGEQKNVGYIASPQIRIKSSWKEEMHIRY